MRKMLKGLSVAILLMALGGALVSCTGADDAPVSIEDEEGTPSEPTSEPQEEEVVAPTPQPQEEMIGPVSVTYPAIPQGAYLPSLIAWPQIGARRNILVEPQFLARTDLAVQAVINEEVDLGISPTNLIVESNLRGGDLVILATLMGNDWAIVGPTEYDSFAELEGERVAIHGPGSLAELYVEQAAQEHGVEVEMVTIPGSAVRAQALLAGEVEASPVFLTDYLLLDMEAPEEFHVLVNVAEQFPENPVNVLYARRDWVNDNQDLVAEIIAGILETHRRVADDPDWAIAQAPAYLGQLEPELIERLVPEYIARGIWPPDGGLNEELAQDMLDFLIATDALGEDLEVEELNVEDHFDFEPLEAALQKLDG